jgi:hypothetical protein
MKREEKKATEREGYSCTRMQSYNIPAGSASAPIPAHMAGGGLLQSKVNIPALAIEWNHLSCSAAINRPSAVGCDGDAVDPEQGFRGCRVIGCKITCGEADSRTK